MDLYMLIATVLVAFMANLPAAITAWAAYRQGKKTAAEVTDTKMVVANIDRKADEIQTQTNGHLTKVTRQLDEAHAQIGSIVERLTQQPARTGRASDQPPLTQEPPA